MRQWQRRFINADLGGLVEVTIKGGKTFSGLLEEVRDDHIILACAYNGARYWQIIDIQEIAAFAWDSGYEGEDK